MCAAAARRVCPCVVLQVETTGDSYMVVAGAPTVNVYHALHISNMALDMKAAALDIPDPSTGSHIKTRIGKSTTSGGTSCSDLSLFGVGTSRFQYTILLTLRACTHSVDNLFHTLMVLWEKENFLTSNLLCFFTSVKLCPLIILLCLISRKK